ncbi:MAG TPA: glycosyltransferase family 39 protein [Candidatus Limnocylindrales bacterium]|nr:glycosyltransferase family 39 protein [Candidatus Limnocylindrales bacterium]
MEIEKTKNSSLREEAWCISLLGVTFLALSIWSWRKWPDILVDFGHELYIPWQLSQGKVLYRDIFWYFGPLPSYLNALWFRLFGVSLTTLIVCNLLILAGVTVLIYRIFKAMFNYFIATLCSLVFLFIFAFSQYVPNGNYNFVCPYSHALTHGTALTMGMIFFFIRYLLGRHPGFIGGAGLCLGLVFLTKPEVGLAAFATAELGLVLIGNFTQAPKSQILKVMLGFHAVALLPSLLFFIFFSRYMPLGEAVRATAGAWTSLTGSPVLNRTFYLRSSGLDQPGSNFFLMLKVLGGMILWIGSCLIADRSLCPLWTRRVIPVILLSIGFGGLLIVKPGLIPWFSLGRALPPITLVVGAVCIILCLRKHTRPDVKIRMGAMALWAMFAFVLLGKIILNARLFNYGFVLAMPATLLLVAVLLGLLPELPGKKYKPGDLFQGLMIALIIAGIVFHFQVSNRFYRYKDFAVGENGDTILTYSPRVDLTGVAMVQALQRIEELIPRDIGFVALPEGVMLNYLSRRISPTRYIYNMPIGLEMNGGSEQVLESFKAHPPEFIILVHSDSSEHGVGYFGRDPNFGKPILDWVKSSYIPLERIFYEPLTDHHFGIKILKRMDAS